MAGIAGIAAPNEQVRVDRMLDKLAHRGSAGRAVVETGVATVGAVWGTAQPHGVTCVGDNRVLGDVRGSAHWARARIVDGRLVLERDALGVAPLYYARTAEGHLCCASEVKALFELSRDVHELPPGCRHDGATLERCFEPTARPLFVKTPASLAQELRQRLGTAVTNGLQTDCGAAGAWLSGGLDSSAITALVRPHVKELHTFAAGLSGAPDLHYARLAADYLGTIHHDVIVSPKELFAALSRVIYHLESFDALLVRSSITNFLVAQRAANYVAAVFSGEGGDELFAGYEYLGSLPADQLAGELLDITGRLHNTALQRVDRCTAAHGLVAHVPFLDPGVVECALRIPTEYKLREGVEKWILRQAMDGLVPETVLHRKKVKFWEGAGVGELLAEHADTSITDADFQRERTLPNGWTINTKEELMYYRVFREHFGLINDFSWMGRTKGAPCVPHSRRS